MTRMLGVDYGRRRMGFAVSDPSATFATPLKVVAVKSRRQAVSEVAKLCRETGSGGVLVGLPLNMDGSKGAMALEAEAFADALRSATRLPVEMWDERLSTELVEHVLLEADVSRKKRKKVRDKMAAQVVLQSYLDSRS